VLIHRGRDIRIRHAFSLRRYPGATEPVLHSVRQRLWYGIASAATCAPPGV